MRRRPAAADGKPSLVVLPFDNLSDDKEQGYLADGITEDLTTELARIPGLFVISRNAAFTYKGKAMQPAQIAKELGVRYILEGSTRRAGDDMRINAQLIDAETGGHLWAERFDGQWAEVFALQDKVVGQVAAALKLRLVSRASGNGRRHRNPAAYDAYLRALQLQYSGMPEDWAKSVEGFEQALVLDPEFGRAAAQLAWMYRTGQWIQSKLRALGISKDEAKAKWKERFDRAAKNPSSIYYQMRSEELLYQQKPEEAIAAAQKAIALDPSDSDGYLQMSWTLIFNGRPQDGRDYLGAVLRLDPKWTTWRYVVGGLAEFSMGRYTEAAALLEKLEPERGATSFWDFWANYNGLRLLVSVYGHLERNADADTIKEKLKPLMADAGDAEFSGIHAMSEFPFRNFPIRSVCLKACAKRASRSCPMVSIRNRKTGSQGRRSRRSTSGIRLRDANGRRVMFIGDNPRWTAPPTSRLERRSRTNSPPRSKATSFAAGPRMEGGAARRCSAIPVGPARRGTSICRSSRGAASSSRSWIEAAACTFAAANDAAKRVGSAG